MLQTRKGCSGAADLLIALLPLAVASTAPRRSGSPPLSTLSPQSARGSPGPCCRHTVKEGTLAAGAPATHAQAAAAACCRQQAIALAPAHLTWLSLMECIQEGLFSSSSPGTLSSICSGGGAGAPDGGTECTGGGWRAAPGAAANSHPAEADSTRMQAWVCSYVLSGVHARVPALIHPPRSGRTWLHRGTADP